MGAAVHMPKATVHEDRLANSYEHQVRPARQVSTVKSKTKSHFVHHAAHDHLGARVLASDTRHQGTTLLRRKTFHARTGPASSGPTAGEISTLFVTLLGFFPAHFPSPHKPLHVVTALGKEPVDPVGLR